MHNPELAAVASPATTRDSFFAGRLVLEQPAKGHRSGTDAVLLAAAVPHSFSGLVYDFGSGVGAVGLGIALFCQDASVVLVEQDPACADMAARNITENGLADRGAAVCCDILSLAQRDELLPRKADLIVSNPPFHRAGRVRISNDEKRRAAHVMGDGAGLEDWLRASLSALAPGGTLILLHRAEAVPEILSCLSGRLGDLALLAVHPRPDQPARRVLVRGRRGSRAPMRIAPPLVLHDGDTFTPLAAAIHEGRTAIAW